MSNKIFNATLVLTLLMGLYGLVTSQMTILISYAIIDPIFLLVVSSFGKIKPIAAITTPKWQETLRLLAAFIILINIPGSIYLHNVPSHYDIPLHFFGFFSVMVGMTLLYPAIAYLFTKKLPTIKNTLIIGFIITILVGFSVEGVQKLLDTLFGTHLFFDIAQPIIVDFWLDITMDVLGGLAGLWFVARKKLYFKKYFTVKSS